MGLVKEGTVRNILLTKIQYCNAGTIDISQESIHMSYFTLSMALDDLGLLTLSSDNDMHVTATPVFRDMEKLKYELIIRFVIINT